MTRMAFFPWLDVVDAILGRKTILPQRGSDLDDPEIMWRAGLTPVEAAAAITVAEFERTLNA